MPIRMRAGSGGVSGYSSGSNNYSLNNPFLDELASPIQSYKSAYGNQLGNTIYGDMSNPGGRYTDIFNLAGADVQDRIQRQYGGLERDIADRFAGQGRMSGVLLEQLAQAGQDRAAAQGDASRQLNIERMNQEVALKEAAKQQALAFEQLQQAGHYTGTQQNLDRLRSGGGLYNESYLLPYQAQLLAAQAAGMQGGGGSRSSSSSRYGAGSGGSTMMQNYNPYAGAQNTLYDYFSARPYRGASPGY